MFCKSFKPALGVSLLSVALSGGLAHAQEQAHTQTPAQTPISTASAQTAPCGIQVEDAWVRATVPGQKGTGAYMNLTVGDACQLVAVQSPIADVAQVHRMEHKGGVMHMQQVQGGLPLRPGQTVKLTPDGLHVMLLDLKQPVAEGATVPITLTLQATETGARGQITVDATVRPLTATGGAAPGHPQMSHDMQGMPGMADMPGMAH